MDNPSLFSPKNPHFFQPLLPGFKSHIKIPVKFFSKHIKGKHEGKTVILRSDSSKITWKVKMDGRRLTNGWKDFVEAHDLRIGDFVVFKHKGDMLFHVTALGSSCCEVQYAPSGTHDEDEESDEIGTSSRKEKEIEENVKTEPDQFSSDDLTCFSQYVTTSNLTRDSVGMPRDFAKRYGLNIGRHEIVLMNEQGKSWESEVKSYKSGQVFISGGWRSLCTENKLEVGDSCTFKLLHNANIPVFQLSSCPKAGVEARSHKRARVQRWSQGSRSKHDVRQKIAEEGEPSRCTRSSNKSTGDQGKFQQTQSCFILDNVAKVKQSVEDTLTSVRRFRAKLQTREQNLEALLQIIED